MDASDGHSLLGLIHGDIPDDWRSAILVEHHGPKPDPDDPDEQDRSSGNPPSYEAMRTPASSTSNTRAASASSTT